MRRLAPFLLLAVLLALAALFALALLPRWNDDQDYTTTDPQHRATVQAPVREVTVRDVLANAAAWKGEEVLVSGVAGARFPSTGFVLRGDGKRIFVWSGPGAQDLERGERAAVRAQVTEFSRVDAKSLDGRLERALPARVPVGVGAPYLRFRALGSTRG